MRRFLFCAGGILILQNRVFGTETVGKGIGYMVRKLQFFPKLYLGEGINADKLDKIKKRLEEKPVLSNVYVITLAKNPENQLEIYDAKQLAQSYYVKYPPYIVGLASDHDEALAVLERIVQECFRARGDCRLKEFLIC